MNQRCNNLKNGARRGEVHCNADGYAGKNCEKATPGMATPGVISPLCWDYSHPNNPQAERKKIPDILICPCPPNTNGFCTTPDRCIAKRMLDQEDCDIVCKAMQELRQEGKRGKPE